MMKFSGSRAMSAFLALAGLYCAAAGAYYLLTGDRENAKLSAALGLMLYILAAMESALVELRALQVHRKAGPRPSCVTCGAYIVCTESRCPRCARTPGYPTQLLGPLSLQQEKTVAGAAESRRPARGRKR